MQQDVQMNQEQQPLQTQAMRLIFEYEGNEVRLVSQQRVEMAVTGFDISQTARAGFFIDTRDADNKMLARVTAPGAFAKSTEVFPENHDEPIRRVDVPNAKGAFTVITPVPKNAHHVTVVHVEPPTAGPSVRAAAKVQDIASFDINTNF